MNSLSNPLHDDSPYLNNEEHWRSTISNNDHNHSQQQHHNASSMLLTATTRLLKTTMKQDEYQRPDYSVLAVCVMTLGLIIIVEVGKHKIDNMARGKRYFTAVLNTFYAELTILGIVELFVWLFEEYYEGMNKDKKHVFAQVHFALFYTAIFNVLQSIVLYKIVRRLSKRHWVQAEALELDHYVEIREEFEAVSHLLKLVQMVNNRESISNLQERVVEEEEAEFAFEFNWTDIQFMWFSLWSGIRYPRLSHRYHALLTQVRFHELRVHLIKANQLPSNFRVSDYLVRSQEQVLMKLLNVTTYAWLILTAIVNLLFFVLGIAVTHTRDLSLPGQVCIFIYFFAMFFFVVVACLVNNKMKLIFKNIMHRNHLWTQYDSREYGDDDVDGQAKKSKALLEEEQLSLFWASSPKLVITLIQFMQFGYAVGLSAVIVFWTEIKDAHIPMEWYLVSLFACYACYLAIAAHAMPRYTLCTSLGQLVDRQRLDETLAVHRLKEARCQRQKGQYCYDSSRAGMRLGPGERATRQKPASTGMVATCDKEENTTAMVGIPRKTLNDTDVEQATQMDPPQLGRIDSDSWSHYFPKMGRNKTITLVEYKKKQKAPSLSFRDYCCLYYKSQKYVVISNIFGTMFAFFFVAYRVEHFLHTENIIPTGLFVSFLFSSHAVSFWLLSIWMSLFAVNDILMLCSLGRKYSSLRHFQERRVWISGVIDLVIVSICLLFFNIAEIKRCCVQISDGQEDSLSSECTCPTFGSRLHGGLGTIEPWTAFIVMRFVRFWAAGVIVRYLNSRDGKDTTHYEEGHEFKDDRSPLDVDHDEDDRHFHEHGHGHDDGHGKQGDLAVELAWQAAVVKHPELVAKYGEFSRELLLAMLNIPILEQEESSQQPPEYQSTRSRCSDDNKLLQTHHKRSKKRTKWPTPPTDSEDMWQNDKLPVSSTSTTSVVKRQHLASNVNFKSRRDSSEQTVVANFERPNAHILLSMRRCDRKVLPILNTWCGVDVVMTAFEMVYFGIVSGESIGVESSSNHTNAARLVERREIPQHTTTDGKGWSLIDMASMRRVIGHVRFSEVTAIGVEPRTHYQHHSNNQNYTYGSTPYETDCTIIHIQTINGHTLYLRFQDPNFSMDRINNNSSAEHWIEMLRRQCGLEPSLPTRATSTFLHRGVHLPTRTPHVDMVMPLQQMTEIDDDDDDTTADDDGTSSIHAVGDENLSDEISTIV